MPNFVLQTHQEGNEFFQIFQNPEAPLYTVARVEGPPTVERYGLYKGDGLIEGTDNAALPITTYSGEKAFEHAVRAAYRAALDKVFGL